MFNKKRAEELYDVLLEKRHSNHTLYRVARLIYRNSPRLPKSRSTKARECYFELDRRLLDKQ